MELWVKKTIIGIMLKTGFENNNLIKNSVTQEAIIAY